MTLPELLAKIGVEIPAHTLLANFCDVKHYKGMPKVYYRIMLEKQVGLHCHPKRVQKYPAGAIEVGDMVKVNSKFRVVMAVDRSKRNWVQVTFSTRLSRKWYNLRPLQYIYNENQEN